MGKSIIPATKSILLNINVIFLMIFNSSVIFYTPTLFSKPVLENSVGYIKDNRTVENHGKNASYVENCGFGSRNNRFQILPQKLPRSAIRSGFDLKWEL